MRRKWPIALILSVLAHATLGIGLAWRESPDLPESKAGLAFSGTTFDVETVLPTSEETPEGTPDAEQDASPGSQQQDGSPDNALENVRSEEPREKVPAVNSDDAGPANEAVQTEALGAQSAGGEANEEHAGSRNDEASAAGSESSNPHGAYGQASTERGTLDLRRAFLKTLPLAAQSDAAWTEVPIGWIGRVTLRLTIEDDGQLAPVEVIEEKEKPVPAILRRMAVKNRSWLFTQRFAIGPQDPSGVQILKITATVSQKAPDPATPNAPGTQALGVRGGEKPTGSYFTYFSGRHVEFEVERGREVEEGAVEQRD